MKKNILMCGLLPAGICPAARLPELQGKQAVFTVPDEIAANDPARFGPGTRWVGIEPYRNEKGGTLCAGETTDEG